MRDVVNALSGLMQQGASPDEMRAFLSGKLGGPAAPIAPQAPLAGPPASPRLAQAQPAPMTAPTQEVPAAPSPMEATDGESYFSPQFQDALHTWLGGNRPAAPPATPKPDPNVMREIDYAFRATMPQPRRLVTSGKDVMPPGWDEAAQYLTAKLEGQPAQRPPLPPNLVGQLDELAGRYGDRYRAHQAFESESTAAAKTAREDTFTNRVRAALDNGRPSQDDDLESGAGAVIDRTGSVGPNGELLVDIFPKRREPADSAPQLPSELSQAGRILDVAATQPQARYGELPSLPPLPPQEQRAELRSANTPMGDQYAQMLDSPLAGRVMSGLDRAGDMGGEVARSLSGVASAESAGKNLAEAVDQGDPIRGGAAVLQGATALLPVAGRLAGPLLSTPLRAMTVGGLAAAAPGLASEPSAAQTTAAMPQAPPASTAADPQAQFEKEWPSLQIAPDATRDQVKGVQRQLKARGDYTGPIDGSQGGITNGALQTYQQKRERAEQAMLKRMEMRTRAQEQSTRGREVDLAEKKLKEEQERRGLIAAAEKKYRADRPIQTFIDQNQYWMAPFVGGALGYLSQRGGANLVSKYADRQAEKARRVVEGYNPAKDGGFLARRGIGGGEPARGLDPRGQPVETSTKLNELWKRGGATASEQPYMRVPGTDPGFSANPRAKDAMTLYPPQSRVKREMLPYALPASEAAGEVALSQNYLRPIAEDNLRKAQTEMDKGYTEQRFNALKDAEAWVKRSDFGLQAAPGALTGGLIGMGHGMFKPASNDKVPLAGMQAAQIMLDRKLAGKNAPPSPAVGTFKEPPVSKFDPAVANAARNQYRQAYLKVSQTKATEFRVLLDDFSAKVAKADPALVTKEGKLRTAAINQLYDQVNRLAGETTSKALLKGDLKRLGHTIP